MIFNFNETFINDSIYAEINDMARSFDETFIECSSPNGNGDCLDSFIPIYSEEGLCFSFNALNSHEILTDE